MMVSACLLLYVARWAYRTNACLYSTCCVFYRLFRFDIATEEVATKDIDVDLSNEKGKGPKTAARVR